MRMRLFYESAIRHFECTVYQVSSVVSRVKCQRTVAHLGVQMFIGKGADFNSIVSRLILIEGQDCVKSNHPFAPNYISTLFKHTSSPVKRSLEGRAVDFDRRQSTKKRRAETTKMEQLAVEAAETWSKELEEEKKRLKEARGGTIRN